MENRILELGDDPYIGTDPRYPVLKRQGYKVLILEKDLERKKRINHETATDRRNIHPAVVFFLHKQSKRTPFIV